MCCDSYSSSLNWSMRVVSRSHNGTDSYAQSSVDSLAWPHRTGEVFSPNVHRHISCSEHRESRTLTAITAISRFQMRSPAATYGLVSRRNSLGLGFVGRRRGFILCRLIRSRTCQHGDRKANNARRDSLEGMSIDRKLWKKLEFKICVCTRSWMICHSRSVL